MLRGESSVSRDSGTRRGHQRRRSRGAPRRAHAEPERPMRDGACAPVHALLPAVTCSVQSTYLTGLMPRDHGIVGNGWYFRNLAK